MSRTTRQRLLNQAIQAMGQDALAARLNVPKHLLHVWLNGIATMPDKKFLLLADVLDESASQKKAEEE